MYAQKSVAFFATVVAIVMFLQATLPSQEHVAMPPIMDTLTCVLCDSYPYTCKPRLDWSDTKLSDAWNLTPCTFVRNAEAGQSLLTRSKDSTFYKTTPKHDSCRRVDSALSLDFLSAVTYIEHDETHIFSQLLAHRTKVCAEPLAAVATVLSRVAERCEIDTGHGHAYGIKHGFVWTFVGLHGQGKGLWDAVTRDLCPESAGRTGWDVYHCLHGVGHGTWYAAGNRTGKCDGFSDTLDVPMVRRALDTCMQAPTDTLAFGCSNGYYHAVFEHLDQRHRLHESWMFPCDRFPFAATCFTWLFAQGSSRGLGELMGDSSPTAFLDAQWRVRGLRALGLTDVRQVCLDLVPQRVRRGCIFGLANTFYPLYERTTVRIAHPSSSPMKVEPFERAFGTPAHIDACIQATHDLMTINVAPTPLHCITLLRANDILRFDLSHTLAEWCGFYYDPARGVSVARREWLVCVAGSMYQTVAGAVHRFAIPEERVRRVCSQLVASPLSPPDDALRQQGEALCVDTALWFVSEHAWGMEWGLVSLV